MYEILPFPNITATESKEQVAQINNYLIQLKESLEFVLTNISSENLSEELRKKLSSIGDDIKANKEERNDMIQQVSKKALTVSDVINSASFKSAIQSVKEEIPKEYLASVKEEATETTKKYTITDSSGNEIIIEIPNTEEGEEITT